MPRRASCVQPARASPSRKAAQALEDAPTGQQTTWRNPDTGTQYSVAPTRTYEAGGTPCREFTVISTVEGKSDTGQGKRVPPGRRHVEGSELESYCFFAGAFSGAFAGALAVAGVISIATASV